MVKLFQIFTFILLTINNLYSQSLSDSLNKNSNENFSFDNLNFQENTNATEKNYEDQFLNGSNKININTCDSIDLLKIGILNANQIHEILDYRKISGLYKSIYELQNIISLQKNDIKLLIIYLLPLNEFTTNNTQNFISLRFSIPDSVPKIYLGDKFSWQFRSQFQVNSFLKINFILENDIGEKVYFNPKTNTFGADYSTIAFTITPKRYINQLIIGDYRAQFGLGLIIGGGFQLGKSANILNTVSRAQWGIMANKSSMESGFCRGIALQKNIARFQFIFASSINKQDASLSIDTNSTIPNEQINTLYTSGLHRTQTEINNKALRNELLNAISIKYQSKKWSLGFNSVVFNWDKSQNLKTKLYQKISTYNYNSLILNSLYFTSQIGNGIWQTEIAAMNQFTSLSYVSNLIYPVNKNLDLALVIRNYSPSYFSPYANSFANNTNRQNEKGVYIGFNCKINSKNTISGYLDKYKSTYPQYLLDFPTVGNDFLLKYQNDFRKNNLYILQIRANYFDKKSSLTNENQLNSYNSLSKMQWMFRFKITNTNNKHTFSGGILQNMLNNENGAAIWQDFSFKFGSFKTSIRNVFFDIENYNLRIYLPENDVPMLFSMPLLYGQGHRLAIIVNQKLNKKTTIYFKGIREVIKNKPISWELRTQINWLLNNQ